MTNTIDDKTKVNLFQILGALATVILVVLWMERRFSRLEVELQQVQQQVARGTADRWSQTEQYLWAQLFAAYNPDVTVPEVPQSDS